MDNNNNWRGRGRGRGNNRGGRDHGRGQGQDHNESSIMSRLGPINIQDDNPPNHRDGKTFSKNRNRGRGGSGFNNRQFEKEFIEEDIEMKP